MIKQFIIPLSTVSLAPLSSPVRNKNVDIISPTPIVQSVKSVKDTDGKCICIKKIKTPKHYLKVK